MTIHDRTRLTVLLDFFYMYGMYFFCPFSNRNSLFFHLETSVFLCYHITQTTQYILVIDHHRHNMLCLFLSLCMEYGYPYNLEPHFCSHVCAYALWVTAMCMQEGDPYGFVWIMLKLFVIMEEEQDGLQQDLYYKKG